MKYPRMLRLPMAERTAKKRYADDSDIDELIASELAIEEKVDGSIVKIVYDDIPTVIGRRREIKMSDGSKPYRRLWSWVWENYEKLSTLKEYTVFGEWMYPRKTVSYEKLHDFYIVFDLMDGSGRYIGREERSALLEKSKLAEAPLLWKGTVKDKEELFGVCKKLAYSPSDVSGSEREGVVIKNYSKQLFMKFVRPEFDKDVEENDDWMHQPLIPNRLADWARARKV